MNFGHGPAAVICCPTAKSAPLPEYSMDFSVSAPMALDAFAMTVFASCATVGCDRSVMNSATVMHFLTICPPDIGGGSSTTGVDIIRPIDRITGARLLYNSGAPNE